MANKQLLKTYHGIAKTPIDANTVFYASLDGTTVAEVGGSPTDVWGSGNTFSKSLTGLGVGVIGRSRKYPINLNDTFTLDFELNFIGTNNGNQDVINLLDVNNNVLLRVSIPANTKTLKLVNSSNGGWAGSASPINNHFRLVMTSINYYIYSDGKLVSSGSKSSSFNVDVSTIKWIVVGDRYLTIVDTLSDVSISNIDRGATFATLPQDFVDGYARIMPAMNEQRQTYSDALTSEYKTEIVKASGETKRQYTLTQVTPGTWATGDNLKVKGLAGEIISGVIDADSALARIVSNWITLNTGVNYFYVDDVSKFAVGDTVSLYRAMYNDVISGITINAIDTTNKILTITSNLTNIVGDFVIESTTSTSSPTVKATITGTATAGAATTITLPSTFSPTDDAYNGLTIAITGGTGTGQVRTISDYTGSTKVVTVPTWTTNPDATSVFSISNVPITGTWSNLGTNQATFTLGTLYALTNQNIQVEYSLNEVAGQGGIPEVLTTTLGGEVGGKKLTVNPTVHIRDDFAGKVSGSVVENPSVYKYKGGNSLVNPSGFTSEYPQIDYDKISTLNGIVDACNAGAVDTIIPQQLFSFNLIEIVERKYGTIPALDVAGKVVWLKANISKLECSWYGYGSCPSGNKAITKIWSNITSGWEGDAVYITTSSPSKRFIGIPTANVPNYIDTNGFVHFLAYTDASNGTIASTIYTDYVNIELTLKTPTGYDVLCPENPRRDDGLSNMLLIRKETREIQAMFSGVSNVSGIVSYGDVIPHQGLTISSGKFKATDDRLLVTTAGTGGIRTSAVIQYADSLYKLFGNNLALYLYMNDDICTVPATIASNSMYIQVLAYYGGKKYSAIGITGTSLDSVFVDNSKLPKSTVYVVNKGLKHINGELYMVIRGATFTNGVRGAGILDFDFKLSGRPLIK